MILCKKKGYPDRFLIIPGFLFYRLIFLNFKSICSGVLEQSLKGNPVRVGDGPAAVIGDENRNMSLFRLIGMGRLGK